VFNVKRPIAMAAAAAALALAAAPAASAGTVRPARFTPPGLAILALQASTTTPQYAATNQGSGNQATTTQSPTNWQIVAATGGYKLRPNGNSSLCLEQDGSNVNSRPCMAGNGNQVWTFSGTTSDATITNHGTGNVMGAFDPNSSRPVYSENPHSGFYIGWRLFT
jgi:hypothetical protein